MSQIIEYDGGAVQVIYPMGEINLNTGEEFEEFFAQALAKKPRTISINCKNVETIDSSGLGLFIKFLKATEKEGIDFVITEIMGNVSSIFDISKLENLFIIMSEEDFKSKYLP